MPTTAIRKPAMSLWRRRRSFGQSRSIRNFLEDLTEREVLLLWEGSAMDRAMRRLVPMFAHGFDERARDAEAAEGAHRLLACLQAAGLYH